MCQKLKDRNFKVILFPCNQFLGQEPGSPTTDSVNKMADGKLDLKENPNVIIAEKTDVNGQSTHKVWDFLKYNSSLYTAKTGKVAPIPWNFAKFVVEPAGGVYKYYVPKQELNSILPDIEHLLDNPEEPPTPTRAVTR